MAERPIADLLADLKSGRADTAWREFLEQHSPSIMRIVRRFERDEGRATDCFVHVCGELSNNGFRRLLSFRTDGAARFSTWLAAVVANLCIDWRRNKYGRQRPVSAVAKLPEIDQLVYRYIFVRGMSRRECLVALQPRFPGLTDSVLAEVNARLFTTLAPRQRWQLGARSAGTLSLDELSSEDGDAAAWQPTDDSALPDEQAGSQQEQDQLAAAMEQLPAQQRLLLRLRYEQELTLDEVARLTGLADPFRANRQIQAALKALAALMRPKT